MGGLFLSVIGGTVLKEVPLGGIILGGIILDEILDH